MKKVLFLDFYRRTPWSGVQVSFQVVIMLCGSCTASRNWGREGAAVIGLCGGEKNPEMCQGIRVASQL